MKICKREIVKKRSKISKMVLEIEMKTRERGKAVWDSKDRLSECEQRRGEGEPASVPSLS